MCSWPTRRWRCSSAVGRGTRLVVHEAGRGHRRAGSPPGGRDRGCAHGIALMRLEPIAKRTVAARSRRAFLRSDASRARSTSPRCRSRHAGSAPTTFGHSQRPRPRRCRRVARRHGKPIATRRCASWRGAACGGPARRRSTTMLRATAHSRAGAVARLRERAGARGGPTRPRCRRPVCGRGGATATWRWASDGRGAPQPPLRLDGAGGRGAVRRWRSRRRTASSWALISDDDRRHGLLRLAHALGVSPGPGRAGVRGGPRPLSDGERGARLTGVLLRLAALIIPRRVRRLGDSPARGRPRSSGRAGRRSAGSCGRRSDADRLASGGRSWRAALGCSTIRRFGGDGWGLPAQIRKYVLLKPMARGGMGEIYLAAHGPSSGFQKFCVIKKVIAEKSDRAKANRFLDEAKVVLRLSHANLVPTFDAGEIDGEFYIAMELVEGKDLREIWNRCVRTRTRIPLDVALHVGREIARALAYVHSYGDLHLVHRDVAPPNILLSLLRRGEADRLRAGAQRAEAGAHRARRRVRAGVVPGARAGARRGRRRAHRRLQPGHRAVGAADREPVPAARQPGSGDGDVAGPAPAADARRRARRPGSRRRWTSC